MTRIRTSLRDREARTIRATTVRTWVALSALMALVATLGAPWKWY